MRARVVGARVRRCVLDRLSVNVLLIDVAGGAGADSVLHVVYMPELAFIYLIKTHSGQLLNRCVYFTGDECMYFHICSCTFKWNIDYLFEI